MKDIAAEHGVTRQAAQGWRKRYKDFPPTLNGNIYNLAVVDRYAKKRQLGKYRSHGLGKATK